MAAVPVIISPCVIYDKYGRTTEVAAIMGMASIAGLGVGGGPMPPGEGSPPGIWGGGNEPFPTPPIHLPGGGGGRPPLGTWGGANEPFPTPPIFIPPQVPPGMQPPTPPAAGSPTTPVPGDWPVQPVTVPPYIVVNYPGVGPVVVAPPAAPPAPEQPAGTSRRT